VKITKLAQTRPLLSIGGIFGGGSGGSSGGPSGQVPIANGSNSVTWGSNVQIITANSSNTLLGPFVNIASGSNVIITLDQGPFPQQAYPSNTLRIHSTATGGSSGITQVYVGYNTVGASSEATTNQKILAKSFTTTAFCELLSVEAHMRTVGGNVGNMAVGLWENNAGVPGTLIAGNLGPVTSLVLTTSGTGAFRWFGMPLSAYLAASTTYWIGVMFDADFDIKYDTSGADHTITSGGWWLPDWGFYSDSDTTKKYSIRGNTIR
jgi:hypothetical protein